MASLQQSFDSFKSLFSGSRPEGNYTSLADMVFNGGGSAITDFFTSGDSYFSRLFDPTGYQSKYNSAEALKNREFQAEEAEKMRSFNSAEALKNREFQERMSNTSYQRARDDMIAAGLNPYLMYGQGGASSPSGSSASSGSASGSSASVSAGYNYLANLVHSAIDLGTMVALFG